MMRAGQAFTAGVTGGIVMSILQWMARTFMGMPVNISMIWGTMFLPKGPGAWVLGFIIHLIVSGLIALVYAWAFENITHHAGVWTGVLFSLVHAVIAGLFMGMLPAMHPRIPEAMPAPGWFMSNSGMMGVIGMFVLHMVYGGIVGAMYHPVAVEGAEPNARVTTA